MTLKRAVKIVRHNYPFATAKYEEGGWAIYTGTLYIVTQQRTEEAAWLAAADCCAQRKAGRA